MPVFWTIKELLNWTSRYFADRGIVEGRLEAEVLLAAVLQKGRVYLYSNYDQPIDAKEREQYRAFIKRRIQGEPLAYITGHREFMSLDFIVNPEVLIPRPDTEVLVEAALNLARQVPIRRICDVGTGSGAIAVSLAFYLKNVEIYALDISSGALAVAQENARRYNVEITFLQGDLLEPLCGDIELDMITANLPYVTVSQHQNLDREVRDHEPALALVAPGDGLDIYRRLLSPAYKFLRPGGYLLLEIDPRQEKAALKMAEGVGGGQIIKDLAGRSRVVLVRRN